MSSCLSELGHTNNILFSHLGVIQILLSKIGMQGLFIDHCGAIALEVGQNGRPVRLINYWNSFKVFN